MIHATVVKMEARSAEDLLNVLLGEEPTGEEAATAKVPGLPPKADESLLLTVRRDLMEIRESILKGVEPGRLLLQVDYVLDMLENALAEL